MLQRGPGGGGGEKTGVVFLSGGVAMGGDGILRHGNAGVQEALQWQKEIPVRVRRCREILEKARTMFRISVGFFILSYEPKLPSPRITSIVFIPQDE